jgi:hypothetical protein
VAGDNQSEPFIPANGAIVQAYFYPTWRRQPCSVILAQQIAERIANWLRWQISGTVTFRTPDGDHRLAMPEPSSSANTSAGDPATAANGTTHGGSARGTCADSFANPMGTDDRSRCVWNQYCYKYGQCNENCKSHLGKSFTLRQTCLGRAMHD